MKLNLVRSRILAIVLFTALVVFPAQPAHAAACTFTSDTFLLPGSWNSFLSWSTSGTGCSSYPGQTFAGDTVIIADGDIIYLNVSPSQPLASLQVGQGASGMLDINDGVIIGDSHTVTVSGNVTISAGGTIRPNDPLLANNIHTLNIGGNFTNNGTFTSTNNGSIVNVVLNGSTAQTIGGSSVSTFNNLTINNSGSGVSHGQNEIVNGILALTTDLATTDSYRMDLGSVATVSGVADVVGTVRRTTLTGTRAFNNVNTQITLSGSSLSRLDITLFKGSPGELTNYVARRYTITPGTGSFTSATVRMAYQDSEFVGIAAENNLRLWRHNSTRWVLQGGTVNTTNNYVELSGVTQFSPWTISDLGAGAPTAVNLSNFVARPDISTNYTIPVFIFGLLGLMAVGAFMLWHI